ncbi:unnamed protein product [Ixodes persulcatus]
MCSLSVSLPRVHGDDFHDALSFPLNLHQVPIAVLGNIFAFIGSVASGRHLLSCSLFFIWRATSLTKGMFGLVDLCARWFKTVQQDETDNSTGHQLNVYFHCSRYIYTRATAK